MNNKIYRLQNRLKNKEIEVAKENRECLEEVDTLENRNVLKLWKR